MKILLCPLICLCFILLQVFACEAQNQDTTLSFEKDDGSKYEIKSITDTILQYEPVGTVPTISRSEEEKKYALWVGAGCCIILIIILGYSYASNSLFKNDVKRHFDPTQSVIIFLLILPPLILVIIGYDKEQITAVLGFFGTIAAYILGNNSKNKENNKEEENKGNSESQEQLVQVVYKLIELIDKNQTQQNSNDTTIPNENPK